MSSKASLSLLLFSYNSKISPSNYLSLFSLQRDDLLKDFRGFAAQEHKRLEEKKAALQKQEKESRVADLKNWYANFQLKTPVPGDLASGSTDKDAKASDQPRDPSLKKSLSPTSAHIAAAGQKSEKSAASSKHLGADLASPQNRLNAPSAASLQPGSASTSSKTGKPTTGSTPVSAEKKALLASMTLPSIPPFNPEKAKARQAAQAQAASSTATTSTAASASNITPKASEDAKKAAAASSTAASSFKFSAKASSFKPFNPNASTFKPGGASAVTPTPASSQAQNGSINSASAAAAAVVTPTVSNQAPIASTSSIATPPIPQNPFFGLRVPKKLISSTPFRLRDDFDPFKLSKVPEASSVLSSWEFTGKPYRQLFSAFPPSAVNPSGAAPPLVPTGGPSVSGFEDGSPQAFHPGINNNGPQGGGGGGPHGNNSGQQPPVLHHSPHPANASGPAHYMQGQPQPFGMYAPHNQQFPFRPGQVSLDDEKDCFSFSLLDSSFRFFVISILTFHLLLLYLSLSRLPISQPPPQQGSQNPQQQQNAGVQGQQLPPQMIPQMGPGGAYGNGPPPFMQMPFSPVPPHGVPRK